MKTVLFVVLYVIGMLLTNAYCQVHRWEDWRIERKEAGTERTKEENIRLVGATALWPIYWASRACLKIVETDKPRTLHYVEVEL